MQKEEVYLYLRLEQKKIQVYKILKIWKYKKNHLKMKS